MEITQRLGIVGGGQLGLMMIQAAKTLNITCGILDPDPTCPCANATSELTVGSLMDYDDVVMFGIKYDVITTEFEHINCDALAYLEGLGKKVFPSSNTLRLIQDKGTQNRFFTDNGFPTPEFELIDSKDELDPTNLQFPVVLKSRRHGYDGKGVLILRSAQDIASAFDGPSVVETMVPIQTEISVIVARSVNGDQEVFDVVEMRANPAANLLATLISPARVSESIIKQATQIARDISNALSMVGVLAVEFFVTTDQQLLVNEVAPRPHNSGHHTIETCAFSQYDQHIRSVMQLPLGKNPTQQPAVMINLLGKYGHSGPTRYLNLDRWLSTPGVFVHLYGKLTTKSFRKMGHVTILSHSVTPALELAETIRNSLEVVAE